MTVKEEVEQLKKELQEQNNKWNKILAYASVISALAAVINLLIAWLNYRK